MADISNFDFIASQPVYAMSSVVTLTFPANYFGGSAEQPPPPNDPPEVTSPSPALMSLVTSNQALSYDVTDPQGNLLVSIVAVLLADGRYEVVHDGLSFSNSYQALSTRTSITNGWRYSIRRTDGWPEGSLRVRHWSVDNQGAQNGA